MVIAVKAARGVQPRWISAQAAVTVARPMLPRQWTPIDSPSLSRSATPAMNARKKVVLCGTRVSGMGYERNSNPACWASRPSCASPSFWASSCSKSETRVSMPARFRISSAPRSPRPPGGQSTIANGAGGFPLIQKMPFMPVRLPQCFKDALGRRELRGLSPSRLR